MTQLIFVEQKPMQGKERVPEHGATIGREGSDINLADPEVSRRHATIRIDGAQLAIEDLGSTNGTYVNGQRVQGVQSLSEGDEVRLGNTVWRVQSASQATAVGDSPAPAAAPPQVTAAREVPQEPPPAPPAPTPAAPQPPAPAPPAPRPPAPPAPAGSPAGQRGDVPAPDFQPSAIRRVVPPPGGPAPFDPAGTPRVRGSAATRLEASVFAAAVTALTFGGVVIYYIVKPFE